jgi:dipeptidyl-peptidase-4
VSPEGVHVREVLDINGEDVLINGTEDEPMDTHVWRISPKQSSKLSTTDGQHQVTTGGDIEVLTSNSMEYFGPQTEIRRAQNSLAQINSYATTPYLTPEVVFETVGKRRLSCAIVLPSEVDRSQPSSLPVVMAPYGGPHVQLVTHVRNNYLQAQWIANQGFAVVIVDGRGSPGRDLSWEKAIAGDLATAPLEDQVDAITGLLELERYSFLDRSRVAIRGWSFGGFLAALAVIRRPDIFRAAIAGAPVTDWTLYDTHYTERYLGDPNTEPENYTRSSLLNEAGSLIRPLMIIHGLVDDNVFPAHSLRLSTALMESGRPHTFLPLAGVTHMPHHPAVLENLLYLQLDFLRDALQVDQATS